MQTLIRKKIYAIKSLAQHARDSDVRKATLSDFLNDKLDIRVSTLQKIVQALGYNVLGRIEGNLVEVKAVYVEGKAYKVGDKFEGKEIVFCFGCSSSAYQSMVLRNKKGKVILKDC